MNDRRSWGSWGDLGPGTHPASSQTLSSPEERLPLEVLPFTIFSSPTGPRGPGRQQGSSTPLLPAPGTPGPTLFPQGGF